MSNGNHRPQTMKEMGSQRTEIRQLPDWMRATINVLFALPLLCLLGYASGMWVPKADTFDNIIVAGSVFAGIFGLIAINFAVKYLEDRR